MTAKKVSKEDGAKDEWLKVHEIVITLGVFPELTQTCFFHNSKDAGSPSILFLIYVHPGSAMS